MATLFDRRLLASSVFSLTAAALIAACGGGGGGSPVALEQAAAAQKTPALPLSLPVPARAVTEEKLAGQKASPSAPEAKSNGSAARSKLYIVQLAEDPVVAYKGGIAGYAATKPNKGSKLDPNSTAVTRYMGYLTSRQDAVLTAAGGSARKAYNYGYVFNGFAAELTDAQAAKLAQTQGVLSVSKDQARTLDTSSTPAFLGLSGDSGFWKTTGATGEGVVIGIVDGGIWPEHLSFSDRVGTNGNASKDGKID